MVIRELLVRLGVITDTGDVKKYDAAIEKTGKTMAAVADVAKRLILGAAAVGAALAYNAVEAARGAEALERQAAALDLTTDSAQAYAATLGTVGGDLDDLSDVFNTITDRAQDAMDGTASMVEDFGLLGVSVDQLRGKGPEQLFLTLADAVAGSTDTVKRNAAVVRLLGDDLGRKLLPVLTQGSAGFAAMASEAQELGLVMDAGMIARGRAASVSFRRLAMTLGSVRQELGLALAPVLARVSEAFLGLVKRNRAAFSEALRRGVERFGDALDAVGEKLGKVDKLVKDRAGGWGNVFARAGNIIAGAGIVAGLARVAAAFGGLKTIFAAVIPLISGAGAGSVGGGLAAAAGAAATAAAPFVLLAAAVVAVGLAFDDLRAFLSGGESLIGKFIGSTDSGRLVMEAFTGAVDALGAAWETLRPSVERFAATMTEKLGPLMPFITEGLGGAVTGFLALWAYAVAGVSALVQGLAPILASGLGAVIDRLTDGLGALLDLIARVVDTGRAAANLISGEGSLRDVLSAGGAALGAGADLASVAGSGALAAVPGGSFIREAAARVPVFAATRGPGPAAGASNTVVNNVAGSTISVNSEMTRAELEALLRRRDQEVGRTLAGINGLAPV